MTTDFKKFQKLTAGAQDILLVTPPSPNYDIIAGTIALYNLLQQENKKVSLLDNNFNTNLERLNFLQQFPPDVLIQDLAGTRDFLLIFNTKYNKILDVSTEKKKEETIIRITPEKGAIDPRDFSFAPADFKYDLAIIIGAPTLEHLGEIYQKNTDLFFEVPKININNDSENDNYGQVNLVDLTAPAISEIIGNLFFDKYSSNINQEIAQALLTGIIASTDSFQKANTTPQTMILASKLIKAKADQSEVIKHLYKTKPLSFLKLWGRTMARLNWDDSKKFIWSLVSTEDFLKSRADKKIIPAVLEELQKNYTKAGIFGIFYSKDSTNTYGEFTFDNSRALKAVAEEYDTKPNGNKLKILFKNKDLLQAEKDFATALNKNL
jgi:nanoRNase/pAp phosphatase (c-di-AMP/oligoRNAs hydrolase)